MTKNDLLNLSLDEKCAILGEKIVQECCSIAIDSYDKDGTFTKEIDAELMKEYKNKYA